MYLVCVASPVALQQVKPLVEASIFKLLNAFFYDNLFSLLFMQKQINEGIYRIKIWFGFSLIDIKKRLEMRQKYCI